MSQSYKEGRKLLINLCDRHGKTALHYAAQKGQYNLVEVLLNNQALTFVRDEKMRVNFKVLIFLLESLRLNLE